MTGHVDHTGHAGPAPWWPVVPLVILAVAYAAGVVRLRRRDVRWPRARLLAAVSGLLALAAALLPPLATHAHVFAVHVAGHLLLAMVAPLLLVLAAPVTLALRALPPPGRRRLLGVLHGAPARVLTWPPVVLALEIGGMAAFYLTGLFALAHAHPVLMALVDLHMVLAGALLALVLVGPDPLPHRPGLVGRLVTLLLAAAGHDVLAKVMDARVLPAGDPVDVRAGAQVMYYGGTAVEVALAVVLMAGWYARGGRALARERRRVRGPVPAPSTVGSPGPG